MDTEYDFFIAYASPDQTVAQKLSWALQDLSRIVFFDKAGLDPGAAWDEALRDALAADHGLSSCSCRQTRHARITNARR